MQRLPNNSSRLVFLLQIDLLLHSRKLVEDSKGIALISPSAAAGTREDKISAIPLEFSTCASDPHAHVRPRYPRRRRRRRRRKSPRSPSHQVHSTILRRNPTTIPKGQGKARQGRQEHDELKLQFLLIFHRPSWA